MVLIVQVIDLDIFDKLESLIFLVGFLITSSYILLFRFSKQEEEEQEKHYYSRHNFPLKEEKNVRGDKKVIILKQKQK